ncbi:MAG TPA: thioredoxin [Bacteroidetes bacterium]|nr:thioredoxin [Bacteroidota bacterium]
MTVIEVHSIEEAKKALKHPAVLLYFFHDHCPPCKVLRPKVQQLLENTYPEMNLVLADGLSHPDLAAQWSVFGFPTMMGMFEGKEYFRKSKFVSLGELSLAIERPYKLMFSYL